MTADSQSPPSGGGDPPKPKFRLPENPPFPKGVVSSDVVVPANRTRSGAAHVAVEKAVRIFEDTMTPLTRK